MKTDAINRKLACKTTIVAKRRFNKRGIDNSVNPSVHETMPKPVNRNARRAAAAMKRGGK